MTMFLNLPNNILSHIFSFDNTYHEIYHRFINNYNNNYNSFICEKCNTFTLKINSFFFEINKSNNTLIHNTLLCNTCISNERFMFTSYLKIIYKTSYFNVRGKHVFYKIIKDMKETKTNTFVINTLNSPKQRKNKKNKLINK